MKYNKNAKNLNFGLMVAVFLVMVFAIALPPKSADAAYVADWHCAKPTSTPVGTGVFAMVNEKIKCGYTMIVNAGGHNEMISKLTVVNTYNPKVFNFNMSTPGHATCSDHGDYIRCVRTGSPYVNGSNDVRQVANINAYCGRTLYQGIRMITTSTTPPIYVHTDSGDSCFLSDNNGSDFWVPGTTSTGHSAYNFMPTFLQSCPSIPQTQTCPNPQTTNTTLIDNESFNVSCLHGGHNEVCETPETKQFTVTGSGAVTAHFSKVTTGACTPAYVHAYIDDIPVATTIKMGETANDILLFNNYPLSAGSHTLTLYADRTAGTCTTRGVAKWDGKITIAQATCGTVVNPPQTGCIDILKEGFNPQNTALTTVPPFTFQLDGNTTTTNDSAGHAHFTNVSVGQHTVNEISVPTGWTNFLVTPTNGIVNVTAGTQCVGMTFKNRQVIANSDLAVSCVANPNPANLNQSVTFQATPTGGTGAYTYQWSGECTGSGQNCSNTFGTAGSHAATVTVTSGTENRTANCSVNINAQQIPILTASCVATPNPVSVNNSVNFNATPTGGTGTYTYQWSGNCTGTSQTCSTAFGNSGSYTALVTVTSGNQTTTANCPVAVNQNTTPNLNISCYASPSTINQNQSTTFIANATGGTGNYSYVWSSGCSAFSQNCTNTFPQSGSYTAIVNVTSGNQSAQAACSVVVNPNQTVCTPNSSQQCDVSNNKYWYDSCGNRGAFIGTCNVVNNTNNFTITKTVRDLSFGNLSWASAVTANPGDIIQFNVAIGASGNQSTNITMLKDTLPANLIYQNTLTVDGVATGGDIIQGINLGNIPAGQTKNIQYKAQVATAQNFSFGTTTLVNNVLAQDSNGNQHNANASVLVTRGNILGATTVSTGLTNNPLFDSFFLPLIIGLMGLWAFRNGYIKMPTWIANRSKNKELLAEKELQKRISMITGRK